MNIEPENGFNNLCSIECKDLKLKNQDVITRGAVPERIFSSLNKF